MRELSNACRRSMFVVAGYRSNKGGHKRRGWVGHCLVIHLWSTIMFSEDGSVFTNSARLNASVCPRPSQSQGGNPSNYGLATLGISTHHLQCN